jgi:hypothetical protein
MCAKRESFEQRRRLKGKKKTISIQIAKGKRFGRKKKLSTHCKGQIGWNRNNLPFTSVIPKKWHVGKHVNKFVRGYNKSIGRYDVLAQTNIHTCT